MQVRRSRAYETKGFRSITLDVEGIGAYATVYQRPGEKAQADLNFFDGDREHGHLEKLAAIATEAAALVKEWDEARPIKS